MSIWEADTGKQRAPISPNLNARTLFSEKDIGAVVYSPDGRRLLTCGGPVRVWDANTGAELIGLASQDSVSGVWSPDGRRVAVGFGWGQNVIKVFDSDTGKELFALRGHSGTVSALAFSPEGSLLASGSPDGTARLWDATRGQEVHTMNVRSPFSGNDRRDSLALSLDGKLVGFAFGSGVVGKKRADGGFELPIEARVFVVATGRDILTLTGLGTIPQYPSSARPVNIAFSPDGKRFAVITSDKTRHWDLATGREGVALEVANDLKFSPDGKTIALLTHDRLSLHDLSDGRETLSVKGSFQSREFDRYVAFSPDGSLAAIVGADQHDDVRLLDTANGKIVRTLNWNDGTQEFLDGSIAFSADGQKVLLCSYAEHRGCIIVWDATSGQLLHAHKGLKGMRGQSVFSPDGSRLAIAVDTKTAVEVVLWDTTMGQEVFAFKGPARFAQLAGLQALTWSADGSTLAIADFHGDLWQWSAGPHTPEIQEARRAAWSDYALDWHRRQAEENEKFGKCSAVVFHLRRLIAAQPDDAGQLLQRLNRCKEKLREP